MDEFLPSLRAPRITMLGACYFITAHLLLGACYAAMVSGEAGIPFAHTFTRAVVDCSLKILVSLPVWFVILRLMDQKPWPSRLLAHAIALPAYLFVWNSAYHWAVEFFNTIPIHPGSETWNVFIASVIYTAQFAILHLVREQALLRNREELAARLRDLAIQAELAGLRGQVMPHFLFNTLHSLSSQVPRGHEKLRSRIAQLGNLLRYTLNASERELVTLREELAFARDYLDLEKARLGDRLELAYQIDKSVLSARVPPVVLQPLVENALKHGVDAHRDGGRVELSIQQKGDMAVVIVRDQAQGSVMDLPSQVSHGVGLRNCAERLRGSLGIGATLSTGIEEGGFRAEIMVPVST